MAKNKRLAKQARKAKNKAAALKRIVDADVPSPSQSGPGQDVRAPGGLGPGGVCLTPCHGFDKTQCVFTPASYRVMEDQV